MTRYTDSERESWSTDDRERCETCGLEPSQCNCDKELEEIL